MGLDGVLDPIRVRQETLILKRSPDWPLLATVQDLYHSARIAAQDISLNSVADSFRSLYRDGTLNWSQLAVLSTCVITMVGCGVFSSFLWRKRVKDKTRPGLGLRKRSAKSPTKILTSSDDDYEDDDYDSNSSLRRGAAPHRQATAWSSHPQQQSSDAFKTDPGILKKFTTYSPYITSVATYQAIRTFFCPHPNLSRLPDKPTPLPLLVFVHGLGGSLAQFHHLLTSLSNVGSCLGIDLPGCGLSKFAPEDWSAYTVEALAELLAVAIENHRDREHDQGVILVGHSLGCSLSALLASSASPIGKDLKRHILGMVAICPKASPPSEAETAKFQRLLSIPEPIFDLWRLWDRRGGIQSTSVRRMVGHHADEETRSLQVRFNKQSRTSVWRRMASGTLPEYKDDKATGGMPGERIWAAVRMPILLVAGEADSVTKPEEIQKLLKYFGDASVHTAIDTTDSSTIPDASRVHDRKAATATSLADEEKFGLQPANSEKVIEQPANNQGRKRIVKSAILPAPASHALLYDRATYRTLSGIIQDFLSQHVDQRLGLGWQLQYMNTSGKWDVKNLAKWQKVAPVSKPIANTFAAMKMLREVDEEHNPVLFSQKYRGRIHAVIDISHESPVYNPNTMEKGGIHYHKHPTVSKIPPTPDETRDFIALVDRLQREIDDLVEKRDDTTLPRPLVGVHCHYGYNRTGFLITCYLIERLGYGVQDAIDEFNSCRPPGIRHGHFVDTLFVRYCVGLKRAPTL
ncbi:Dual specificity protein phosphatase domain-containing protein [Penicillium ucsense]|uniref:Dual specificity protein phosphatase domain-containing protein n=1 Tax=Penicillium ucsense TaxID=2839758 RepID=A0A8J8WC95_9EURO|nr:Dual specificity protein phosphatase domain-containing protein [Penicillium ucsense]KAF7733209.1 Dual specificity protein phosphatase domain-containing protein [Penicillium ucsense]